MSEEKGYYESVDDYDTFVREMWMNHHQPKREQLAIATLGIAGEAGEVAEKVKKSLRGDYSLFPNAAVTARDTQLGYEKRDEIVKELGDVLFYISTVARLMDYDLAHVMVENARKLTERKAKTGTLRGDGDNR